MGGSCPAAPGLPKAAPAPSSASGADVLPARTFSHAPASEVRRKPRPLTVTQIFEYENPHTWLQGYQSYMLPGLSADGHKRVGVYGLQASMCRVAHALVKSAPL